MKKQEEKRNKENGSSSETLESNKERMNMRKKERKTQPFILVPTYVEKESATTYI